MESYRDGNFYFIVIVPTEETIASSSGFNLNVPANDIYQFTVPLDDIRGATVKTRDKALLYTPWIKKALSEGTLIKI